MSPAPARPRVLAIAALALVGALAVPAFVEAWVRLRWDPAQGTPGFYVSDPELGERLAPGYDGTFAGVPVHINRLGFRDSRDYAVAKPPGTFRILVLGDSVTFGHGTLQATTYPALLEARLRAWRPDVRWEVWNLGVPGYNTRQELQLLQRVGPEWQPDFVIVGFYGNDFAGNEVRPAPTWSATAASTIRSFVRRHFYSYELYRRLYLTARWRLTSTADEQARTATLADADAPQAEGDASASPQQALTPLDRVDDEAVASFECFGQPFQHDPAAAADFRARVDRRDPSIAAWLDAVESLQALGRAGTYRLMFFVNMAPKVCPSTDRFYDAGTLTDSDALVEVLGRGVPAVSVARDYLPYRPSQMPGAGGHSIGNANVVKADTLFRVLSTDLLPPLLPPRP